MLAALKSLVMWLRVHSIRHNPLRVRCFDAGWFNARSGHHLLLGAHHNVLTFPTLGWTLWWRTWYKPMSIMTRRSTLVLPGLARAISCGDTIWTFIAKYTIFIRCYTDFLLILRSGVSPGSFTLSSNSLKMVFFILKKCTEKCEGLVYIVSIYASILPLQSKS